MIDRPGIIKMHGKPLTLTGRDLKIGFDAPDFEVIDNDFNPVKFSSFDGKIRVIATVPSLDTPVCDMQTRRFNQEAASMGDDIVVLTISVDLPFAQKRWCGNAGVENVITLSDYKYGSFGTEYGVMIKEMHILARAVFVVDKERVLQYTQIVREISEEPDYDDVLNAIKKLS
jgi:thiol peroxidase